WIQNRFAPIASAIRDYRPAIVHTFLDWPAVVGGLAACCLGVPRVLIFQGSMTIVHREGPIPEQMQFAYRCVAQNPNVVMINNSTAGAADFERWLGLRKGTIRVHLNGFRPETLRQPSPREVIEFRETL